MLFLKMPRSIDFTLRPTQIDELEALIRSASDGHVVKRAIAIRQLHNGNSPDEIAEMLMVSANTIYEWHKRWRAEGADGLAHRPRSGRPPKADETYCNLLESALENDPADFGYSFTIWTTDRLRAHLEEQTGISLSRGRFAILMERLGYVYRRPKRDLSDKQDQEAKAEASQLIDELKKGRNSVISSFSLWTKQP